MRPRLTLERIQMRKAALEAKGDGYIDLSAFLPAVAEQKEETPANKILVSASQLVKFSDFKDLKRSGRIAVVLHLHYADLWPELRDKILNIPEPFDLFVSVHDDAAEKNAALICGDFPLARVLKFENRGRDILPFVAMINAGLLQGYDLVCKIHSKKSLKTPTDGDNWRRASVDGILGSRMLVRNILNAYDEDKHLGLVAADGQLFGSRLNHWAGNLKKLALLGQRISMTAIADEARFVGGTMFWMRASLLRRVEALNFSSDDFEAEPIGADGAMAHAVERMFGLIAYEAGMHVCESSALEAMNDTR
jgi:lipopolysaccharide biosynthesis protein